MIQLRRIFIFLSAFFSGQNMFKQMAGNLTEEPGIPLIIGDRPEALGLGQVQRDMPSLGIGIFQNRNSGEILFNQIQNCVQG